MDARIYLDELLSDILESLNPWAHYCPLDSPKEEILPMPKKSAKSSIWDHCDLSVKIESIEEIKPRSRTPLEATLLAAIHKTA